MRVMIKSILEAFSIAVTERDDLILKIAEYSFLCNGDGELSVYKITADF